MPENPWLRPLRSAALVMLCIAAADGAIKTIEYFAGTPLWKMMLATGVVVLVLDVAVYDRGIVGQQFRAGMQQVGVGLRWFGTRIGYALQRFMKK